MIWREKRILLIVLALLLIGNTIFFFTYRIQYEARLKDLDDRRAQSEAHLAQERAPRARREEGTVGRATDLRPAVVDGVAPSDRAHHRSGTSRERVAARTAVE